MDEMIVAFFDGKPVSFEIFKIVYERARSLGPFEVIVKSQISFGVDRKFAWFWLYNVTQKNPNGVLHAMLCADRRIGDPHVRGVNQIGTSRWNHQIVVRTSRDAQSKWLLRLLHAAYEFGGAHRP
jgi:hypothetical protein